MIPNDSPHAGAIQALIDSITVSEQFPDYHRLTTAHALKRSTASLIN
ncbi:MAG: hypothetical protein AABX62_03235 [Thermoproteota archaeon]